MSEINWRVTPPNMNGRMPTPGGNMQQPNPGMNMGGSMQRPNPDMRPDMNPDMGAGMNPEMRPGMGAGMNPEMRPDMGAGMNPEMRPDMGPVMRPDMRPDMNPGMRPDMRPGMRPGMNTNSATNLCAILRQNPHATAVVRGGSEYPDITGRIMFYQMRMGVLVAAEVFGLPAGGGVCENPVFGFHIHSGSTCSGNMEDPFADVQGHYNPDQCIHPQHAGDMPPLFGNNGYAFQVFLTDRFTVREVIGKTVIIHSMPDDFRSQPGGDAGAKIACGQILGREAR